MKNIKYITLVILSLFFMASSCQDDDTSVGDIIAPTNLIVTAEIVGADADNPYGDGSGLVIFSMSADNALNYRLDHNGSQIMAPSGVAEKLFTSLGVNTYTVTAVAIGTGGITTTTTLTIEVLANYEAPADLIEKLVGDGSKTWRMKSEVNGHFGLGPVGGQLPVEWYSAGAGEKSSTGMYDDRYIFSSDGTFTHITNSVNDDPDPDTSGTVFGRDGLIDELGPHNEEPDGADILNYPYSDYSENYVLINPGGLETISISGLGFIGYYTAGNHQYQIFDRSVPNELVLKTTDGNSEFDWWFIITSEEPDGGFESDYNNLVWSDEFDVDGAPDPTKWTYDLGTGDNGWGNGEAQTYTNDAENVIVANGSLVITAKAEGTGYTSTRLKSEDLFEFTYGRVEVRAKVPSAEGTWPAIWMLGEDYQTNFWPGCGEIDIMEHTGNNLNTILGTLHYPGNSGGNANGSETTVETATTEFHNYTVDWSPSAIRILVDDNLYFTFANTGSTPFNNDFFLILNVAMGGTLGGAIDPAFVEDSMEIDYVRVYQ